MLILPIPSPDKCQIFMKIQRHFFIFFGLKLLIKKIKLSPPKDSILGMFLFELESIDKLDVQLYPTLQFARLPAIYH